MRSTCVWMREFISATTAAVLRCGVGLAVYEDISGRMQRLRDRDGFFVSRGWILGPKVIEMPARKIVAKQ